MNKLGQGLRIDKLAGSSRFGDDTAGFAAPPGIDLTRFPGKKIAVRCPAGSPNGLRVNAFRVGWHEDQRGGNITTTIIYVMILKLLLYKELRIQIVADGHQRHLIQTGRLR